MQSSQNIKRGMERDDPTNTAVTDSPRMIRQLRNAPICRLRNSQPLSYACITQYTFTLREPPGDEVSQTLWGSAIHAPQGNACRFK